MCENWLEATTNNHFSKTDNNTTKRYCITSVKHLCSSILFQERKKGDCHWEHICRTQQQHTTSLQMSEWFRNGGGDAIHNTLFCTALLLFVRSLLAFSLTHTKRPIIRWFEQISNFRIKIINSKQDAISTSPSTNKFIRKKVCEREKECKIIEVKRTYFF